MVVGVKSHSFAHVDSHRPIHGLHSFLKSLSAVVSASRAEMHDHVGLGGSYYVGVSYGVLDNDVLFLQVERIYLIFLLKVPDYD